MISQHFLRLSVCILALGLAGCSNAPKDEATSGWNLSSDDLKNISNGTIGTKPATEEEGPEYQQPTMDVLRGKPQKFPANFPIKRYPGAQISMVDVRKNRPAGYKNMVLMKTDDRIASVDQFYNNKLATEQWKQISSYSNQIYESTIWEKDNLQCEVRIAQDFSQPNGKRLVQLLYGIKAKPMVIRNPAINNMTSMAKAHSGLNFGPLPSSSGAAPGSTSYANPAQGVSQAPGANAINDGVQIPVAPDTSSNH